VKLTKKFIQDVLADEKELFVWDESLAGFGLRVKPSGVKTYIVQYRNRFGRSKRVSLGRVGVITLDQARKEAGKLRGQVALGVDPAQTRSDDRTVDTIRALSDRYMKDHCEGRCKGSTMKAHRWLLDRYILPTFGAYRIKELTPQDVGKFHQRFRNTKYNANRSLGLLKAMFGKAEQWGLMEPNSNPASVIKPFRENKRQRYLSPEEFKQLFDTLDQLEHLDVVGTYPAVAIRLLALTGCRLSEILHLEWTSVDLGRGRLLLQQHKTDHKGEKAVPLNTNAVQILKTLPKQKDNPYVIVGRDPGTHLVNLQKPWKRLREHADLNDVRLHDLRHSFASVAASSGISLPMIGALLGHTSPQSTARYAHLYDDPIREASELIGGHILDHTTD
jgi:integrase